MSAPDHGHFNVATDDGFICGICGRWSPMPFPVADPDPPYPLDRATRAAERELRRAMASAGWPRWAMDLLAEPIAQITVGAAWKVWKFEISAWQRPTEGAR